MSEQRKERVEKSEFHSYPLSARWPRNIGYGHISVPKSELGTVRGKPYALTADGNCLTGDDINDGDLVIVDPDADFVDGKIYIVRIGNWVMAKHVHRVADKVQLIPSNANYDTREVDEDEVEILGRVILSGSWKEY